jgi:hypothetical protein
MPRSASKERQNAIARVELYLAPCFESPLDDDRPLSVAAISKALAISPATIKKHGLDARIREALALRHKVRPRSENMEVSRLRERIAKLEMELAKSRARYDRVLEMYTRIEFHLRQSAIVDLDALLKTAIPRPARFQPSLGRKSGRRNQAR